MRSLGHTSVPLLDFIRSCPVGCDTLVLRILVDLSDKGTNFLRSATVRRTRTPLIVVIPKIVSAHGTGKPPRELVDAARVAFASRELDSRFMIPMLPGFNKVGKGTEQEKEHSEQGQHSLSRRACPWTSP